MTATIEVARQAEAPGAVVSGSPGGPPRPRWASRQRDIILIVTLLAAAARSARRAEAASAQISRGPGGLPQPASRQRAAILIVSLLAAEVNLAPLVMSAIMLAAIRRLVRDNQVIPRVLTWYFGPVPAWVRRRRNRRYLRQQMLDAPAG
jgi:uncharacterized protein YjiS (DUF1127 family)